jgi:hypothetical protein
MNQINFQASVSHVTQVERQQHETHRVPISHQEQNANLARDEALQRINMPVETEEAENKIIENEERRKEFAQRRKRRQKKEEEQKRRRQRWDAGQFIDVDV